MLVHRRHDIINVVLELLARATQFCHRRMCTAAAATMSESFCEYSLAYCSTLQCWFTAATTTSMSFLSYSPGPSNSATAACVPQPPRRCLSPFFEYSLAYCSTLQCWLAAATTTSMSFLSYSPGPSNSATAACVPQPPRRCLSPSMLVHRRQDNINVVLE